MSETKHVVIVGGGTAGWLAAARIASAGLESVSVTLVESPDVPTVGVGEGTWPSMCRTLKAVGLSEKDLFRHCDASFKQGTLFRGWCTGAENDSYLHPFSLPPRYASTNLAELWRVGKLDLDFCAAVSPQGTVARTGKAPKTADMPDYAHALTYGYHVNAGKFAELLRSHSTQQLAVNHVLDHVVVVNRDTEGFIASLQLQETGEIQGDLFIDCTGQRALLIGDTLGSEFRSVRKTLPNNRAVVAQVPYAQADAEIHSCTQSTARNSGWIWDIGLQSRRGVGYVHDSDYASEDEARSTLRDYIDATSHPDVIDSIQYRTLAFEPGYRPSPWLKNCVAMGLSAGFIEPLEASALALIEQAAGFLVDNFPRHRQLMGACGRSFNRKMAEHWEGIQEFLKLHYVLSQRTDTEYWRRASALSRAPETLQDMLALWQLRAPWHLDTPRVDALFPAASYQYVWLGMTGQQLAQSKAAGAGLTRDQLRTLDQTLHEVREQTVKLRHGLPSNRELLNTLSSRYPATEAAAL